MFRCLSHGPIITIVGPVGVGKSTQIRKLQSYFRSRDQRVVVTFIKTNHLFSYAVRQFLMTLGLKEEISYHGAITRIFLRRSIVKRLFPLLLMLDTLSISAKFLFTVYLPFYLGYAILIEEGLAMSLQTYLMSYPHFYGTHPKVLPLLPRLLSWVSNQKHVTIIIDAEDQELDKRRKCRSYRKDEVPEFVSLQRKGIRLLVSGDGILIDTTDESAQDVYAKIIKVIEENIPQEQLGTNFHSSGSRR